MTGISTNEVSTRLNRLLTDWDQLSDGARKSQVAILAQDLAPNQVSLQIVRSASGYDLDEWNHVYKDGKKVCCGIHTRTQLIMMHNDKELVCMNCRRAGKD